MQQFDTQLRRWDAYKRLNQRSAEAIELLAETLLATDHIDSAGVAQVLESRAMKEIQEFLHHDTDACEALGLSDPDPISILETIDLYALARIFRCEHT